ncbi:hypothetical protein [Pseudarcicella hirudinis]|nr:hypothetical protein [Pseudarcicella hirudinis]
MILKIRSNLLTTSFTSGDVHNLREALIRLLSGKLMEFIEIPVKMAYSLK